MSTIKVSVTGKISTFGGPKDTGVSPSEGLALFTKSDLGKPVSNGLFLPVQPVGTTGLARRLNPNAMYIAMRWDYKELPRDVLRDLRVTVTANGRTFAGVRPVDWGPHIGTTRAMDISPGLATLLSLKTDQEATVSYQYELRPRPFTDRAKHLRSNAVAKRRGRGRGRAKANPSRNLGKPRKVLAKAVNFKGSV